MSVTDLGMIFKFVGGLGLFLYGMNLLADGLQKTAGSKTKGFLAAMTKNRFLAVIFGALITAIIQSSSATTVMIVGFVNAGILNLTQAVGVIMGANIGTTITSWIVSMSEWSSALKPEFFAPLIIGIGAFVMMFSKKDHSKKGAEIAIGFGILFIGLSFMSGSITPYKDSPVFSNIFATLGKNPLLGVLAGLLVTAIIQSSSASVGILQTLALNGVVNWQSAVFITLGQNIGTCVTALISSTGANKTAKRASIIHLLFNTIGSIIFGIVMFIVFKINTSFAASPINSIDISIFHSIFNIACTIMLFPFANQLVKLSGLIIKDGKDTEVNPIAEIKNHLDPRILSNPSFAIEAAKQEVLKMGNLALINTKSAYDGLINGDAKTITSVFENESIINKYEKQLTEYLVKIDTESLTPKQHSLIKNLLYTVSDIERISDHCENIAELSQNKLESKTVLSAEGAADLQIIYECVILSIENALATWEKDEIELATVTRFYEDKVDELEEKLREKHINRLSAGICSTSAGIIFLDVISNFERISDHAVNIAEYLIP